MSVDMAIPPERVHWKIQTWNRNIEQPRALYVPYFDARDVQQKLDELFGWDGWSDDITIGEVKGEGYAVCHLTIHRWHDPTATPETGWHGGQFEVVKSDAAPLTDIESVKGGASDAFKRAAAKLGVGRNAYTLPTIWASCQVRGEGDKARPYMPDGHEAKLTRQSLAIMAKGGGEGEYEE